jgi:hypothetical protein
MTSFLYCSHPDRNGLDDRLPMAMRSEDSDANGGVIRGGVQTGLLGADAAFPGILLVGLGIQAKF